MNLSTYIPSTTPLSEIISDVQNSQDPRFQKLVSEIEFLQDTLDKIEELWSDEQDDKIGQVFEQLKNGGDPQLI